MFRAPPHAIIGLCAVIALPLFHGSAEACTVMLPIKHRRHKKKIRLNRSGADAERENLVATSADEPGRVLARSGNSRAAPVRTRSTSSPTESPKQSESMDRAQPQQERVASRSRNVTVAVAKTPSRKSAVAEASSIPQRTSASAFKHEVFFDLGKASVEGSTLDAVISWLQSNPDTRLVIEGHTDNSGSAAFNRQLSVRRAKVVRALLVEQTGVSIDRIRVVGFGESRIADPSDASKNRRVVIFAR